MGRVADRGRRCWGNVMGGGRGIGGKKERESEKET